MYVFLDDDCPNSLVRQKEGAQGEEEAGGRRKGEYLHKINDQSFFYNKM